MTALRTYFANSFITDLTADVNPNDLTYNVVATAPVVSPAYIVFEMDDDAKREYVLADGVFTGTAFVSTNISKRYLAGSAAGSNLTHLAGTKVRVVPTAQAFADIHDRIDVNQGATQTNSSSIQNLQNQLFTSGQHALTDHSSLPGIVAQGTVLGRAQYQGTNPDYSGAITKGSWVSYGSGTLTIPATWGSYDVVVDGSAFLGESLNNIVDGRVVFDGNNGSTMSWRPRDENSPVSHLFTGLSATGSRAFSLQLNARAANIGNINIVRAQVLAYAIRTS